MGQAQAPVAEHWQLALAGTPPHPAIAERSVVALVVLVVLVVLAEPVVRRPQAARVLPAARVVPVVPVAQVVPVVQMPSFNWVKCHLLTFILIQASFRVLSLPHSL